MDIRFGLVLSIFLHAFAAPSAANHEKPGAAPPRRYGAAAEGEISAAAKPKRASLVGLFDTLKKKESKRKPLAPDERMPCLFAEEGKVLCGIGDKKDCDEVKGVRFLFHTSCRDPFVKQFWPGKTGACVQINSKGKRLGCSDQMQVWESDPIPGALMTGIGKFPTTDRACYNGQVRFNFDARITPMAFLVGKTCKDLPKVLTKDDARFVGRPHHRAYSLLYTNFIRFLFGYKAIDANGKLYRASRR